jgi:hypothetical protein
MPRYLSDYTVVYKCNGARREYYLKAWDQTHATLSAQELIPDSCEIVRTYRDSSWS